MTLLTIIHAVADETSGPRPATIASNTNPDAQNYLRLANKVGRDLMNMYAWNNLRKEQTLTADGTEILVSAANMPADFDRFVPETMWDRGSRNLISGPISPVEWNSLKTYNPTLLEYKFIFRGGAVSTIPSVASGNTVAYEYVSKNFALANDGVTYKSAFTADNDTSLIDDELIVRGIKYWWLADEGQPWQGAFKDYMDYFNNLQENENATNNICVAGDVFSRNSRHSDGAPRASQTGYLGNY